MSTKQTNIIAATAGWRLGGLGPSIYLFSPEGAVLQRHPVAANHPTNRALGDSGLCMLYVTSKDGHLFRPHTGRQGLAVGRSRSTNG